MVYNKRVADSFKKINKKKIIGYLSFLFLIACAIRAIILESKNEQMVVFIGIIAVMLAVNAVLEMHND